MMVNLYRGCPLLPAPPCAPSAHVARLKKTGGPARARRRLGGVPPRVAAEARRVAFLEPLDELEEYRLIQKHYIVSWGVPGPTGPPADRKTKIRPPNRTRARLERVVDRSGDAA